MPVTAGPAADLNGDGCLTLAEICAGGADPVAIAFSALSAALNRFYTAGRTRAAVTRRVPLAATVSKPSKRPRGSIRRPSTSGAGNARTQQFGSTRPSPRRPTGKHHERQPVTAEFTVAASQDTDGDGIPDGQDNCPAVTNPDQTDANGNGTGDVCEGPTGTDTDHDGIPDSIDLDDDNDLVPDVSDNCGSDFRGRRSGPRLDLLRTMAAL